MCQGEDRMRKDDLEKLTPAGNTEVKKAGKNSEQRT